MAVIHRGAPLLICASEISLAGIVRPRQTCRPCRFIGCSSIIHCPRSGLRWPCPSAVPKPYARPGHLHKLWAKNKRKAYSQPYPTTSRRERQRRPAGDAGNSLFDPTQQLWETPTIKQVYSHREPSSGRRPHAGSGYPRDSPPQHANPPTKQSSTAGARPVCPALRSAKKQQKRMCYIQQRPSTTENNQWP